MIPCMSPNQWALNTWNDHPICKGIFFFFLAHLQYHQLASFHSKIQTTGISPPWGVQIIYLFSLSPNLISSQQSSINQQGTGTWMEMEEKMLESPYPACPHYYSPVQYFSMPPLHFTLIALSSCQVSHYFISW